MKKVAIIVAGILVVLLAALLTRQQPKLAPATALPPIAHSRNTEPAAERKTTPHGDVLTDARDPEFVQQVLPALRDYFATLDRLGMNPLPGDIDSMSFNNIRIGYPTNGMVCRFVIGEAWTATYAKTPGFSGILYFGQRGPDNPLRAVSRGDTNALSRLSQGAISMPRGEVEGMASRVADAFGIDLSKYEKPDIRPEGLFDYNLGLHAVRYRLKGTDPINQINYPRMFMLKATSPTTAVLVSYSNLEAPLLR